MAHAATEPSTEIVACAAISHPGRDRSSGRIGNSASARFTRRATVSNGTPMSFRERKRSTRKIAGNCAACATKGIAPRRPIARGPAPISSAKATSTTPPDSEPVRVAQPASATSARWPAASDAADIDGSG